MVRFVHIGGVILWAMVAGAAGAETEAVDAALVVSVDAAAPSQAFRAGVLFRLAPGWHLYWRNPGDSGIAPAIRWHLPPGWTARECPWPAPRRFADGPLVGYGYADEVLLSVEITAAPLPGPGAVAVLGASVNWLACGDLCVPGGREVAFRLAIGDRLEPGAAEELFDRYERSWPRSDSDWAVSAWREGSTIRVGFRPPAGTGPGGLADLEFFPFEPGLVAGLAGASDGAGEPEALVSLPLLTDRHRGLGQVEGVLVTGRTGLSRGAVQAFQVRAPLAEPPRGAPSSSSQPKEVVP